MPDHRQRYRQGNDQQYSLPVGQTRKRRRCHEQRQHDAQQAHLAHGALIRQLSDGAPDVWRVAVGSDECQALDNDGDAQQHPQVAKIRQDDAGRIYPGKLGRGFRCGHDRVDGSLVFGWATVWLRMGL